MCILNIKVDDAKLSEVRPHFDGEKDLQAWFEMQMEHVMMEFLAQFESPAKTEDDLLERLEALGDTSEGFLNLDTVLPPSMCRIPCEL